MTASDVRDTARASVLAYDEAMKQQV